MTRDSLIQEVSQGVQQKLEHLQLQLTAIHPLNISRVLELESEIRQYASHQQSDYFKKGLVQNFIDWHSQNKARCILLQTTEQTILGYGILILDPELIKSFYEPTADKLEDSAYLAQIVISPNVQGQGFGRLMMNVLESISNYHGKKHLLLEVHSLTPAYEFYKNLNYKLDFFQAFMSKTLGSEN
tara:strand:+ start:716 stop:1270 length:555 start_codon:yes stop_codon:yes gene_type:complete